MMRKRTKPFTLLALILMFFLFLVIPLVVMAQAPVTPVDPTGEVNLGQYTIPGLITLFLMIIFNFLAIGDRYKPLIAIGLGVGLGILAIPYNRQPWEFVIIVDCVLYGIIAGAAAVGLYEGQKAFRKSHRV